MSFIEETIKCPVCGKDTTVAVELPKDRVQELTGTEAWVCIHCESEFAVRGFISFKLEVSSLTWESATPTPQSDEEEK